jgi:hypothetical protein
MTLRNQLKSWRFVHAWLLAPLLLLSMSMALAETDRVALVIGNDAYPGEALKNATNDARAVARTLTELGFKVVVKTNADYATMRGAAVEFSKILDGATAAVFYYAGHGIQYRGKNYLVPIDAKLTSEAEIVFNALEVGQVMESMEESKVKYKFIILDACRNNPFSNVVTSTGLAKIARTPQGTIISFAAAEGAVAQDGDGENGLYTKHLLEEIRNPQNQALAMFQQVQIKVAQDSQNKQSPELYSTASSNAKPFFFAERSAPATSVAASGVSGDTQAGLDREFWTSIKDSRDPRDYQAYLQEFPRGTFATLARNRAESLRQAGAAPILPVASGAQNAPAPAHAASIPLVASTSSPSAVAAPATIATTTVALTTVPVMAPAVVPAAAPTAVPAAALAATIQPAAVSGNTSTAAPTVATLSPAPAAKIAAPLQLAAAAGGESRGIEPKPATPSSLAPAVPQLAPVLPATANLPSAANESRVATVSPPPASSPATAVLPPPQIVASLSPEQRSALPPVPALPKVLSGVINFPDGSRYVGEYKEDKDKTQLLDGKGEFISKNFTYNGDFKNGVKQGRGAYEWPNGDKFEGDFADDRPNGRGVWQFASGDRYEGDIVKGAIVGKGVMVTRNGDRILGTFIDGKPEGRVSYMFASGDKYEGEMTAGRMNGKGVYSSKDGNRTEATFVDDNANGKGVFYFANGDRYEGEIVKGAITGQGSYYYSNGLRSEGVYLNGALKGPGKFYFNDGSWFEGSFEDGLKKGKGTMIYKDGTKRPAEMIDGIARAIE